MLDDMFSFIDPIVELSEDDTRFVIQVEAFFEFLEQIGFDRAASSPEGTKIAVPLDIVISLLRPDELEKLKTILNPTLRNVMVVKLSSQAPGAA